MNRLTRAHNSRGEEALYFYNGLGQRVGREAKGERDTYLLDLTKAYHNLLSINGKDKNQTFYWDNNVTAMEEGGDGLQEIHYYLQDELGSPLRVSTTDGYLTYGYDEFGNDLGRELERAGIPNPYTKQGDEQPFGYTGYRYDNISNTYFAQAREYQPESGRFTAEDVIKGNGVSPITLNLYSYCLNMPLKYMDYTGKYPENEEVDGEKWMEERGHSFWWKEEGLHEGNVALPLNSNKLKMSKQGKEVLKKMELEIDAKFCENIVVRDEMTGEVVAVYPYYVGDGGIAFGYGHYMNYDEVMMYKEEKDLLLKYVNIEEAEITPELFDDNLGTTVRPRKVPNSSPVPLEELDVLFESDVDKMTKDMLINMSEDVEEDFLLTIQQLDALLIIRFNTGHLGESITSLVESGAPIEEWDKVINSKSSDRRRKAKDIFWGNIFTYEECIQ